MNATSLFMQHLPLAKNAVGMFGCKYRPHAYTYNKKEMYADALSGLWHAARRRDPLVGEDIFQRYAYKCMKGYMLSALMENTKVRREETSLSAWYEEDVREEREIEDEVWEEKEVAAKKTSLEDFIEEESIEPLLKLVNKKYKEVLLHLLEGYTQTEIAQELRVSRARVWQIKEKIAARLYKHVVKRHEGCALPGILRKKG